MRILDCHAYVGRRPGFTQYGVPEDFTGSQVIAYLDRVGIEAVLAAPPGVPGDDYTDGMRVLEETSRQFPERVLAYARIHPLTMPNPAETAETCIKHRGFRGLKLNAASNPYWINDRRLVHPILERITDPHVPVLVHTGDTRFATPALVADVAQDFPRIPFIIGHMGQLELVNDAIALARRVPNLYLDTGFNGTPNTIHDAVRILGPERVLFGSNGPYLPFEMEIEKITRFARLTDQELLLVMGGNLARILGI